MCDAFRKRCYLFAGRMSVDWPPASATLPNCFAGNKNQIRGLPVTVFRIDSGSSKFLAIGQDAQLDDAKMPLYLVTESQGQKRLEAHWRNSFPRVLRYIPYARVDGPFTLTDEEIQEKYGAIRPWPCRPKSEA